ncbi:MAG TPA: SusC/RagA family TonB-linked outer membrane protein [Chitinophagaceae bacterium]|nr:SusC/RagA family TonB-linked outer membrane protein [Chitinophagaceae bacterium]
MRKLLLTSTFFLLTALSLWAQRVITGKVTDDKGVPVPNASVLVRGTKTGTVSGSDGSFSLTLPSGATSLEISSVGYETQYITIGQNNAYSIELLTSGDQLGEVVVTAGGILVKRRELGTVATSINSTQITQAKASNFAASLSGKVAGLQVNAVNGGLNPNYRLVLRGQRSITGDNQALLVLDNLIVPSSLLGNLNPEDIEDIQVLNGSAAAAAYGSDASNGAIVITTKKGRKGRNSIRVSNTTTLEKVSFYPQLQNKFGSGTTPDAVKTYTAYENQQYGPRFDGSMVEIGKPLEDGSIQTVPYSPRNDKKDFWETGLQNQTDLAFESGDDKSTLYVAAQYFTQKSTVPKDKYERISVRANGTRNVNKNVLVKYTANYISNLYDMTSVTSSMYNEILMTPSHVPLTRYQNWKTDPYANPNGYFNEYYDNPYWSIDNWRQDTKNEYFQGNLELAFTPVKPLTLTYRVGMSSSNQQNKSWAGKFIFSDYTKSISGSSKTDVAGSVSDSRSGSTQLVSELIAEYRKKLGQHFELYVLGAGYMRANAGKSVGVSANGLVIDELYNVGNTQNNPGASESNNKSRQVAIRGEARLGFKDYLFLHVTARNDWTSVLEKENRSFFYPSADISFIATDAITALQNISWLNTLKLRAAYAYVGNVNLGPYALNTTFGQAVGYPYGGNAGFSVGSGLVAAGLKPEITQGPEMGIDFELLNRKIQGGVTYYKTNTHNQTMNVSVSTASGFSSLRTNIGEVQNTGVESFFRYTPIQSKTGLSVTIGANYALNRNKVISLTDESDVFNIGSGGGGLVVAEVGQPFPLLKTTYYKRDTQGRVIVDPVSGFPSFDGSYTVKGTTNPPHILGVDFEVLYKGLRFSTIFEYRTGHYILNAISTGYDFSGAGIRTTWYNRERFVFPNSVYEDPTRPGTYIENTNITTRSGGADFWTDGTRNTGVGENYTHSAAFWKWREAVISYDLPIRSLGKVIKKATVSVQGRNLFIWVPKTNLYTDPEYSALGAGSNAIGFTSLGQTPPARYIGGTISLTF